MTEYQLTVWGNGFMRGIWYFETKEAAEREKKRWEHKGWHCDIKEVIPFGK